MTKAIITATTSGRFTIAIAGIARTDFALTWRGEGRAEFRRTADGTAETVTVQDIKDKNWPDSAEADVLSLSHPDTWTPSSALVEEPGNAAGAEQMPALPPEPTAEAAPGGEPAAEAANSTSRRRSTGA